MNRHEARLLLEAFRPDSADAASPEFREALAWLDKDPELAQWFAGQQQFDRSMRAAIGGVEVPPQLRQAILTGGKFIEMLPWWRLVRWRMVASVALMMLTASAFFWLSYARTESLMIASRQMLQISDHRLANLSATTNNLDDVRHFLRRCNAPSDFKLPAGLQALHVMGCSIVPLQQRTASLIAFQHPATQGVRLFVITGLHDETLPDPGEVKYGNLGDWNIAIWTDGTTTYLLAGRIERESLRRLLL